MQNKPEPWPEEEPVPPRVAALHRAIQSELAVRREDPERGPAVLNGLLERLWVERMGLAEAG